ncbi:MAG: hypothetical protein RLZ98_2016 [Pseudomonadota bacterium]
MGTMITMKSREGADVMAYLALPQGTARTSAVVFASSIHGIGEDHQVIADAFAAKGYICLAPDLFWRTVPGPLARDDGRNKARAMPRAEKIATGEADMADALEHLKTLPNFDGRAIAMGFCYGGPYAILGPKRLGYAGGVSCHGSDMWLFEDELDGVTRPVTIIWGDKDHAAPPDVIERYKGYAGRMPNLSVDILPDVNHGYMLRGNLKHFDQKAHDYSFARAIEMLEALPPQ